MGKTWKLVLPFACGSATHQPRLRRSIAQGQAARLHNAQTILRRCRGAIAASTQPAVLASAAASGALDSGAAETPPLGVHALVWEGGWSRQEAFRVIRGSARAGYEVPLLDPAGVDAAMTRDLLAEHGLAASGSTGLTFETDISSDSAEVRAAGKALLTAAMQKAAEFGAKHFVGVTYSAMGKYSQPASAEQWRHCAASLKELAAVAADLGLVYGLEFVNRYETNLLNTAAQAMDMISDVNADNVRVHLDTYHMNIEERSMGAAVATCGDRLGYVHVGESHRGHLGTGSVDYRSFFNALAAGNYRGPITFESFSSAVVSPTLSNALCVWRDLWEDSEDLATHAQRFMAAHWHAAAISHADISSTAGGTQL